MCQFTLEVETLGQPIVQVLDCGADFTTARALGLRALGEPGTLQVSLVRTCAGVERSRATRVAPAFGGRPLLPRRWTR